LLKLFRQVASHRNVRAGPVHPSSREHRISAAVLGRGVVFASSKRINLFKQSCATAVHPVRVGSWLATVGEGCFVPHTAGRALAPVRVSDTAGQPGKHALG